jgi:hypothetical protein
MLTANDPRSRREEQFDDSVLTVLRDRRRPADEEDRYVVVIATSWQNSNCDVFQIPVKRGGDSERVRPVDRCRAWECGGSDTGEDAEED